MGGYKPTRSTTIVASCGHLMKITAGSHAALKYKNYYMAAHGLCNDCLAQRQTIEKEHDHGRESAGCHRP
jgi:hypothetical protein